MQIGLVGVGKMGAGIMRRLRVAGHGVVVYDPAADGAAVASAGATMVADLPVLLKKLATPRIVWLMIPSTAVSAAMQELLPLLSAGDMIVDGGNSYFKDSLKHAALAQEKGVTFVDVGVSGGVAGEKVGYALMAGGSNEAMNKLQPIFAALQAPNAFLHAGPVGAGHFVKMVHNAVEYGMMQAIGEGFDLLKRGPFEALDVAKIAELWSHGTIVRSFLMELAASALKKDGELSQIAAYVDDSGEGRWSAATAIEHAIPFFVNTAALYTRFDSRQPDSFAIKLIAALRQEFGGHSVKQK